jgi:hypothetical protein
MRVSSAKEIKRFSHALIGGVACLLLSGCLHSVELSENHDERVQADRLEALTKQNKELHTALSSSDATIQDLEQKIAGLKIQLLEYETLIKENQGYAEAQQRRLDAAIIEVVRTKARLRSLESKAEAASTIAEAEIAVNALKKQAASSDIIPQEELSTVDQLLKMSSSEFRSQNFGGALFLANQTKGQVRDLQMRMRGSPDTAAIEGETTFAQPLPLKLLKKSNLRKGPGVEHKILLTLEKDNLVTGYSRRGDWIRVTTSDGQTGWLFQSLVGAR